MKGVFQLDGLIEDFSSIRQIPSAIGVYSHLLERMMECARNNEEFQPDEIQKHFNQIMLRFQKIMKPEIAVPLLENAPSEATFSRKRKQIEEEASLLGSNSSSLKKMRSTSESNKEPELNYFNLPLSLKLKILSYLSAEEIIKTGVYFYRNSKKEEELNEELKGLIEENQECIKENEERNEEFEKRIEENEKCIWEKKEHNRLNRKVIRKAIVQNMNIHHTYLTSMGLSLINMKGFLKAEGSQLKFLGLSSISKCPIQTSKEALELMGLCRNLKYLAIEGYSIGNEGVVEIVGQFPELKSLSLADSQINAEAAITIAKGLTSLETLLLESCNIGDSGAKAIGEYLKDSLKKLDLSHNSISDRGITDMAKGLKQAEKIALQKLDLSGNYITDTGITEMAKLLKKGTLLELSLIDVTITHIACQAIAEAFLYLQKLNLSATETTDAGVNAIVNNLKFLRAFDITGNIDITDQVLESMLQKLPFLNELAIGGVNSRVVKTITAALPLLKTLELIGFRINDTDLKHLAKAAPFLRNFTLYEADIGDDGVNTIINDFKFLQETKVRDCDGVSKEAYEELGKRFKMRVEALAQIKI